MPTFTSSAVMYAPEKSSTKRPMASKSCSDLSRGSAITTDLPPLRAARSLALGAIDNLPPLKRLAVRHGMQNG